MLYACHNARVPGTVLYVFRSLTTRVCSLCLSITNYTHRAQAGFFYILQMSAGTDASRLGNPIRVVGGVYIGKTGWYDTEGNNTAKMVAVIIHKVKNSKGAVVNRATRISRKSVTAFARPQPASYAQAALQQHPKIEQLMVKLCRDLAMCEVGHEDDNIHTIFAAHLKKAVAEQHEKGSDALWKQVTYPASA